jgi:hypothetical protein
MRNTILILALFLAPASAQLTPGQKMSDFLNLSGLYAKNYAPYEWKRDIYHYDLLDLRPWLDQVAKAKDDLDFLDVCVRYVAALKSGGHDRFLAPSRFSASLGFTVDIYEGSTLVDSINRGRLPSSSFPFQIGDELVSVDGKTTTQLIDELSPYGVVSSPGAMQRSAAQTITTRSQQTMPRAVDVGDTATVVIRRQNGDLETYTVPWFKSGMPLTTIGPVPNPAAAKVMRSPDPAEPDYMAGLRELQRVEAYGTDLVLGAGSINPVFALPDDFVQRLGRNLSDEFFSGIYSAEGHKIGFIRIPSFSPASQTRALQQFGAEMQFFEANTDGLIIDDMRNPGGSGSYLNSLMRYLMPNGFQAVGFEVRATSLWVENFSFYLQQAKAAHAEQWVIDTYQGLLAGVMQANSENRGRTGAIPVDAPTLERGPATDGNGNIVAYSKPLLVLADEFSASGGDLFPATIQDNGRGPVFGMPTMGLGGTVSNFSATAYSEAVTRITMSLMHRKNMVVTGDFPATPYIENVGVRPDIVADYMTRDNLLNRGKSYVAAFTAALLEIIR